MQVCPALSILPKTIRSAALGIEQSSEMIAGDLPLSSRVTGVRFWAAAVATLRPTAVEPVKKRWSNGVLATASPTSGPPVTTVNSSGENSEATIRCSNVEVRDVISLGFNITRFPAASAAITGENDK